MGWIGVEVVEEERILVRKGRRGEIADEIVVEVGGRGRVRYRMSASRRMQKKGKDAT